VYVRGQLHCWKDDGLPLTGPLSGEQVCHFQLSKNGKVADEGSLPIFLRDDRDPNVGIFIPWDKLYFNDTDHNVTLFKSLPPAQYLGQIEELYLPHGHEMHAVGEAIKNGPRLELRPSPKRPKSLYITHTNPIDLYNFIEGYDNDMRLQKATVTVAGFLNLALGAALFGGGWYLRKKYVQGDSSKKPGGVAGLAGNTGDGNAAAPSIRAAPKGDI